MSEFRRLLFNIKDSVNNENLVNFTLLSSFGDISLKIITGIFVAPLLRDPGINSTGISNQPTNNIFINDGVSVAQLDSATDCVAQTTALASSQKSTIISGMIAQEIVSSVVIVGMQSYTLWCIWQDIKAATDVIKDSPRKIAIIDTSMKELMKEHKKLAKMFDRTKLKSVEQMALQDIMNLTLKLSKVNHLVRRVTKALSSLKLSVDGSITTLKSGKKELIKSGIITGGQIISHAVEFGIYASSPMGTTFWCVKSLFTALYVAIATVEICEYVMCRSKLAELQEKFAKIEEHDKQLEELEMSIMEKQEWFENLQRQQGQYDSDSDSDLSDSELADVK